METKNLNDDELDNVIGGATQIIVISKKPDELERKGFRNKPDSAEYKTITDDNDTLGD